MWLGGNITRQANSKGICSRHHATIFERRKNQDSDYQNWPIMPTTPGRKVLELDEPDSAIIEPAQISQKFW